MSQWGHLEQRYQDARPRKMLSLDGGGIRGVITLKVLKRLEEFLAKGDPGFRLRDYFDYIAGTSTGGIIAAGLAIGMSVSQLLEFYREAGPLMFEKSALLSRYKSLYRSEPLTEKLREVFGEDTLLGSSRLSTLLLVVTRNASTDSPWPVSNNPWAKYNDPTRSDSNLRIPLWKLVRASTAAPVYFPPEVVDLDSRDPNKTFAFVDGGATPYNNPAFLLYRMATLPPYRLNWEQGERKLLVVSVGTGSVPRLAPGMVSAGSNLLEDATGFGLNLMYSAQIDQDINCRTVGRCTFGAEIDGELGDLIPRGSDGQPVGLDKDLGKAFLYVRYDVDLTRNGLEQLGLDTRYINVERIRELDAVEYIDDLLRIGTAVSEKVRLEHLGPFA